MIQNGVESSVRNSLLALFELTNQNPGIHSLLGKFALYSDWSIQTMQTKNFEPWWKVVEQGKTQVGSTWLRFIIIKNVILRLESFKLHSTHFNIILHVKNYTK